MLYRYNEVPRIYEGMRVSDSELVKRKSGEAIVFSDGQSRAYFGAGAYGLLKKLMPQSKATDAVYGDIACAGEASGRIKVVRDFADAENMAAGQILVASMTTPDIALAMEKATGIITDEGGVTCHAAIIAREYAVPCLVGTKIATQVLRDGMNVELDCVNGLFRIINDR